MKFTHDSASSSPGRLHEQKAFLLSKEASARFTSSRDSALFILELIDVMQIFVKQMDECTQF